MMLIYMFDLEVQETYVFKTSKQPKKSAAEGGRLLRLLFCLLYRCFLGIQIKTCRLASYLMEHIYFEAQLCSKLSMFKENSKNIYIYHSTLCTCLWLWLVLIWHSRSLQVSLQALYWLNLSGA